MKTINSFTATLAAALLLGGAPALASADEMQAGPIQLNSVHSTQTLTPDATEDPGLARIAFTNTGSMPATDVVFAVTSNDNHVVDVYDAAGSFAPGVTISKAFPSDTLASPTDGKVAVQSVTYADGSVWVNPDVNVAGTTAAPETATIPGDNSAAPSEGAVTPNDSAMPNENSAPPSSMAPGETAPGSSAPNPQY